MEVNDIRRKINTFNLSLDSLLSLINRFEISSFEKQVHIYYLVLI